MEAILLKKRKKLLKNKKNKPNQILDEVFDFADQHPQDPMALSASLLVVAKTIIWIYWDQNKPQKCFMHLHKI